MFDLVAVVESAGFVAEVGVANGAGVEVATRIGIGENEAVETVVKTVVVAVETVIAIEGNGLDAGAVAKPVVFEINPLIKAINLGEPVVGVIALVVVLVDDAVLYGLFKGAIARQVVVVGGVLVKGVVTNTNELTSLVVDLAI